MEESPDLITDGYILRLGKEEGDFEPWHIGPEDWFVYLAAFLDCLNLTRNYGVVKDTMSATKKARTARKRLAKKVEQW